MLSTNLKKERLEKMFAYNSPAYVFTKNVDAPKEFVEAAIAYQKPLLKSKSSTSGFIGELTNYLQSVLATREVVEGQIYNAKVVKIESFGCFVEVWPGCEGLVHISKLSKERVEQCEDIVKVGDEIIVKAIGTDNKGRLNFSRRDAMSKEK